MTGRNEIGAAPEDVATEVSNLLDELQEISIEKAFTVTAYLHAKLENIHLFADGNGRVVRLWHTALLARWKPIFEYVPIESRIEAFQDGYYQAIADCHVVGDSDQFITFMLAQIDAILDEIAH